MTTRAFRKSSIKDITHRASVSTTTVRIRAAVSMAAFIAVLGAFSASCAFYGGRAALGQTPSSPSAATAPPVVQAALHAGSPRQTIYGFGGSITYGADSTADFAGREAAY